MNCKGLLVAGELLLTRVAHTLERHPRQVSAAIAALLLGGGGAAFAVATASASLGGVDPALLPVSEVIEPVEPASLQQQSEALDAYRFSLFRTELTRSSDTADTLLARLGVIDPAASDFLRGDAAFRTQVLGRAGRMVTAEADDRQGLVRLTARWPEGRSDRFTRLVVERSPEGTLASRVESAPLVASLRLASGTVRSTFFEAMDEARVADHVARQVLDIFDGDIDFHRGLHAGDRFNVVYESLEADGESMRAGRVISAEFVNRGKLHQALWYQEPGKTGGYFDLDGRSLARAYLASPMEVSRITSGFKTRFHPVLHQWRQHKGVDYGGPVGAPVRTIGDGVVTEAGFKGAYGNTVVVDHGGGDRTLYAHLSRVEVVRGQKVLRGQRVGALGATGLVTGPHLHFEFLENGVHKDPLLAVRRNQAPTLSAHAKADFDRLAQSMRLQFAAVNGSTASVLAAAR